MQQNRHFWFIAINNEAEKEVDRINMALEIAEQDIYVVGNSLVKEIVQYLLTRNTPKDIERASEIVSTFTTVGRANEASYASYQTSWWNSVEGIFMSVWNEEKVGRRSPMNFYPHRRWWQNCWYFLQHCYVSTGGGTGHTASTQYSEGLAPHSLSHYLDVALHCT